MRATPTLVGYDNSGTINKWVDTVAGAQTVTFAGQTAESIGYVVLAAGTAGYYGHWTASAEL